MSAATTMIGRSLGPYQLAAELGEGGPPLLASKTNASFGASTVAQARIRL